MLADEPATLRAALREYLSGGVSYPAARAAALKICCPDVDETLYRSPNNILGIEYIKALLRNNSKIIPASVTRKGGQYADNELSAQYSSATAIRRELIAGGLKNLGDADIPAAVRPLYIGVPVIPASVFPYILFCLRSMDIEQIRDIYEVSEGLEYKLQQAAYTAQSYGELIGAVKSKRYTQTRIQRTLLYIMMNLTKEKAQQLKTQPLYARVLAVKRERLDLLSELKAKATIPVITKASEFSDSPLFDLDIKASDLYALLQQKIAPARRDFTQKFLII